jgi:L-lysine exporter family protein LysE/ArgO
MNPFFEGLWLGLAYAMPIGAQNVFVLNAASKGGFTNALRIAAIVSIMDISLAIACFMGVGQVLESWPILTPVMTTVGALFLFYIGWNLLTTNDGPIAHSDKTLLPITSIIKSAFVLTWFNPQALIDGTILFGGVQGTLAKADMTTFILGASFGSAAWFFSISSFVGLLNRPIPKSVFRFVNIGCGIALIAYGVRLASMNLF